MRVGIVQAGRIVEERVLETPRRVTVGTSAASTFIVPWEGAPPSWRLFDRGGGRWVLHLGPGMSARIATGEEIASFPGGDPSARPGSAPRTVLLRDGARGKIMVGDTTVLFQLVQPPARVPRPRLPIAVQRNVLAEIDGLFTGLLALVLALHVAVVVYLRTVDWPRRPSVDELPDRFVRHLRRPARPELAEASPTPAPRDRAEAPGRQRPPAATAARPARAPARTPAPSPEVAPDQRRAALVARVGTMGLLPLLTTPGETSSSSAAADLLANGAALRSLDEALRGVRDVEVAGDTSLAHLPSPRAGTGRVGIPGRLRGGGPIAAPTETGARAERHVRPDLRVGPPEIEGGHADPQAIAREIRDRRRAITACYERALKQQPTLAGKLVVRFTIAAAGTVVSVAIDDDTLGAPSVAACVRSEILRWRFTTAGEGPLEISFPFVFQAGD